MHKISNKRDNTFFFLQIRFIASRGNGFKGDIAVDNIEVAEGQCG